MKITGTVAVATNGSGRVIASLVDFGQNRPGGFTVQEAQEVRLRDAIAKEVIRRTCAEDIYQVATSEDGEHTARSLMHLLCEFQGWSVHFKTVGSDIEELLKPRFEQVTCTCVEEHPDD